jgi:molybdenum storage protein
MSQQDNPGIPGSDQRHHMSSFLMRESLIDKDLQHATQGEHPTFRMLPQAHVVKIGGRSVMDKGRAVLMPLVDVLSEILNDTKLILGCGGGARTRHVFSIGMDLGLPTGVLAQLSIADALGNAHMLGTLLAPQGVVAIPPEIFGHLLPFFLKAAPGVIMNGDPPYSIWEHPPSIGRIPPHRTDAGSYLVAECFGCETFTLVKDVDGLYAADPATNPDAEFIPKISVSELRRRNLQSFPFDEVMLDLLDCARLVKKFQIINGNKPELLKAAIAGEHVGTIVHAD